LICRSTLGVSMNVTMVDFKDSTNRKLSTNTAKIKYSYGDVATTFHLPNVMSPVSITLATIPVMQMSIKQICPKLKVLNSLKIDLCQFGKMKLHQPSSLARKF
jgi:hypothetical protein